MEKTAEQKQIEPVLFASLQKQSKWSHNPAMNEINDLSASPYIIHILSFKLSYLGFSSSCIQKWYNFDGDKRDAQFLESIYDYSSILLELTHLPHT